MPPTIKKLLRDPIAPGELRYFLNQSRMKEERVICMVRDGIESRWGTNSPCSHPCGPYGWVTDLLLSGFTGIRWEDGEIRLCRSASELGDIPWKWC